MFDFSVDKMNSEITKGDFLASVSSNGEVYTAGAGQTATICSLRMTFFPFDHHKCEIRFSNWLYTSKELKLFNLTSDLDLKYLSINSQWHVKRAYMDVRANVFEEEFGIEEYEFVVVTICKYQLNVGSSAW